MVNCPKCGALVEKGSNFCQECGTKVKTPKNSINTTTSDECWRIFLEFNYCLFLY